LVEICEEHVDAVGLREDFDDAKGFHLKWYFEEPVTDSGQIVLTGLEEPFAADAEYRAYAISTGWANAQAVGPRFHASDIAALTPGLVLGFDSTEESFEPVLMDSARWNASVAALCVDE